MKEKSRPSKGNKILFFFLTFLFAVSFFVFIGSLSLKATFINPQYYKDVLKKTDTYNKIVNEGIPSMLLTVHISDNQLTDSLAKELSILLMQKVVDPMWLEGIVDTFITKTVAFLQNPDQSVTLDVSDFRTYLDKVSKSMLVVEELIPGCKEASGAASSVSAKLSLPLSLDCAKTPANLDEIKADLKGIRQGIDSLQIGVLRVDQTVKDVNSFIESIRLFIKNVNLYLFLSLGVMFVLLVITVWIQRKDPVGLIRSLSLYTGISSLTTLLIVFIVEAMTPKTLGNQEIILSSVMRVITNDFLQSFITGFFQYARDWALGVFIASGVVYVIAVAVGKRPKS